MEDHDAIGTADRRRDERKDAAASVLMRLDVDELEGDCDNVSNLGLLFFTEDPLRVVVEIREGAEARTRKGTLVRVQRMSETNTGLAIEFDPE